MRLFYFCTSCAQKRILGFMSQLERVGYNLTVVLEERKGKEKALDGQIASYFSAHLVHIFVSKTDGRARETVMELI